MHYAFLLKMQVRIEEKFWTVVRFKSYYDGLLFIRNNVTSFVQEKKRVEIIQSRQCPKFTG